MGNRTYAIMGDSPSKIATLLRNVDKPSSRNQSTLQQRFEAEEWFN